MKKFKFLFLAALIAVMFIGCAQPTDDTIPLSEPEAQPTVIEANSFLVGDNVLVFCKDASVTYSDGQVHKYVLDTIPKGADESDNCYSISFTTCSISVSTIDFFNGTPIIIETSEYMGDANKLIQVEFKFSELYKKVE